MANTGTAADTVSSTESLAKGSEALAKAVMANTGTAADTVSSTESLAKGSEALAKAVMANTGTVADTVSSTESLAKGSEALAKAVVVNTGTLGSVSELTHKTHGAAEVILSSLPKHFVRRYVFVRSTGIETVFALAGFETGQRRLNSNQKAWLEDFKNSVQACGNRLPTIRLVGFASAQPNSRTDGDEYHHLCRPPANAPDPSGKDHSDLANCRLANWRLAHVASFWKDPRKYEDGEAAVVPTMADLATSCATGKQYEVSETPPRIIAKPWCQLGQMRYERFHAGSDGRQPDFLNRSVHFRIADPGSCSALKTLVSTSTHGDGPRTSP